MVVHSIDPLVNLLGVVGTWHGVVEPAIDPDVVQVPALFLLLLHGPVVAGLGKTEVVVRDPD